MSRLRLGDGAVTSPSLGFAQLAVANDGTVLADTSVLANFDLAPDGRVLVLLPTGDEPARAHDHARLVLNLFD